MASALLTDLVALFAKAWPALATSIQVSIGGVSSALDPLQLAGADVGAGGGPCPWACGRVTVQSVRGLATMVPNADAATLQLRACDPLAVVLTIPMTVASLEVDAHVDSTILGMGASTSPTLTLANLGGVLALTLPIATLVPAQAYALQLAGVTASLYLNVQSIAGVSGIPGTSTALVNDLLQAGLAPVFARLASHELSDVASNFLQAHLAGAQPIPVPASLLPGIGTPPPPPQACTRKDQAWSLPCDPCDTCCLCATQSRCADADCAAQCGACMPSGCTPPFPPAFTIAAIALGVVLLLILAGVSFGLYKAIAYAVTKGGRVGTGTARAVEVVATAK